MKRLYYIIFLPLAVLAIGYTNIAPSSSIEIIDATSVVIDDFNGDGFNDLYFSCRSIGPSIIYINDGTGCFARDSVWVANPGVYTRGVGCGDYDNDGDPDLAIMELGGDARLYRNDGTGFTDVTTSAGIDCVDRNIGIFFLDYDDDGFLDLFLCRYLAPAKLYKNNGDGTFTDVSVISGFGIVGDCLGVTAADFDNDGDIDIVITTSTTTNYLMRDDGVFFTDVGPFAGFATFALGNGPHAGDFDGDGLIDIAFSTLNDGFRLFRNIGGMSFVEVSVEYGIDTMTFDNESALFIDGDGDTDLDLLFTSMSDNYFYRNDCSTFVENTPPDADPPGLHVGAAAGDLDGDHVPEIVICGWESAPHIILKRERSINNHWIEIQLEGTSSNRDAIGARVTAVINGIRFIQEVGLPLGRASCRSAREVYFEFDRGLKIDTLFIRWPIGGVDTVFSPAIDTSLLFIESTIGIRETALPTNATLSAYPNPFNSAMTISAGDGLGYSLIEIYDVTGKLVDEIEIPGRWTPSSKIGSGVYFARPPNGHGKKLIYLK